MIDMLLNNKQTGNKIVSLYYVVIERNLPNGGLCHPGRSESEKKSKREIINKTMHEN